ncbi:MAG: type II secretion system major pseudopilin GspG [Thermodesulfobacteriota bacterium]
MKESDRKNTGQTGAFTFIKGRLSAESGFTLIEIIVVVIIIGLLATLVAPRFFGKVEQSKIKTTYAQIELIGAALDMYRLDIGDYPTTSEGIEALRTKPSSVEKGWDGPYLKKEVPVDAWGRPYIYTSPGKHGDYDLVSLGADGTEGGEGKDIDIVSWKGLP